MTSKNHKSIKSLVNQNADLIREQTQHIFDIDAAVLADNIAMHVAEQNDMLAAVETSAVVNSISISPLEFYCSKTGKKIGNRDTSEIEQMVNFYGLKRAEELIQYVDMTVSCSPIWLVTNPDSLDKLMKIDPCGYFIYAASFALQRINPFWSKDKGWREQSERITFQNQKIISYQLLQNLPVELVIQANEIWRKTLAIYHPRAINWPFGLLSEYCNINAFDILKQNVMRAVEKVLAAMERMDWLNENWNLIQIIEKQGGAKEVNNFLRQRGYRGESLELAVTRIFADFGMLNVYKNSVIHVPQGKPMTRYEGVITKQKTLIKIANEKIKEKPNLLSLLKKNKD